MSLLHHFSFEQSLPESSSPAGKIFSAVRFCNEKRKTTDNIATIYIYKYICILCFGRLVIDDWSDWYVLFGTSLWAAHVTHSI